MITNKRKPRVTVTKDLIPSDSGGLFDLQVNGSTESADAGDGGLDRPGHRGRGSSPTVGEVAGTDTDLDDYESSIACSGDSTASSSDAGPLSSSASSPRASRGLHDHEQAQAAREGDQGSRAGRRLRPVRPAGQRLEEPVDATDSETTDYVNVAVGSNPTVGEVAGTGTDLDDYESSIACTGDSTASSSDAGPLELGELHAGEVVDCTITNKRKPRVKVTKDLVPSGDGGLFDLQVNGLDGGRRRRRWATDYVNVPVGSNPTVGEVAGTGTDLDDYESSIACTGDSAASSSERRSARAR